MSKDGVAIAKQLEEKEQRVQDLQVWAPSNPGSSALMSRVDAGAPATSVHDRDGAARAERADAVGRYRRLPASCTPFACMQPRGEQELV